MGDGWIPQTVLRSGIPGKVVHLLWLVLWTRKDDKVAVFNRMKEILSEYGTLVDSQSVGLNNYAEPILSLFGNNKNESKKWKCSLTAAHIEKEYADGEDDLSAALRQDYGIFAEFLNDVEDTSPPKFIREVPPFKNINNGVSSKVFEEAKHQLTKSDLYNDSANISKEQEPHFLLSERNQKVEYENDLFEDTYVTSSQGATNGCKRGQYPWNKVGVSNNRRGVAAVRSSHGASNSFHIGGNNETYENLRNSGGNFVYGASPREAVSNPGNSSCEDKDSPFFKTAAHQLALDHQKKYGQGAMNADLYGSGKRSLGVRRTVNNKFVPPVRKPEDEDVGSGAVIRRCLPGSSHQQMGKRGNNYEESPHAGLMEDERLKNIEPKMIELIMNEIMDSGPPVSWDDIAGLEIAKTTIQEIIVWPMLRPDIFTGLRGPPKGILLFGPPGTGKTMIGKCIASQSGSTFFSISASSLTSKWIGEGEKMVRAMFAVARCHQPAVIFIDEIDSLLTQRSDTEHESSRRIKTEFLVQLDGATSGNEERLLLVGATNRPQELDEAARRRLVKRLYIPLPEEMARQQIIRNLMMNQNHSLTEESIQRICQHTDGYSGADMANLCREAALGPIRSISFSDIKHISVDQVRPISEEDFMTALFSIRASVSDKDLQMYEDWNKKYGIASR
ncbi:fidgetin-like protein 1 isoform X2 [Macrobrachium rosenbergii]|uniref:fidgetin-like protein 1 isoform X2 n=1 Tax=Macrobrachium rosenbergii TaxID=79674 RepID=UPI0034D5DCFC